MYDISEDGNENEENDNDEDDDDEDDDTVTHVPVGIMVWSGKYMCAQRKELGASCKAKQPKELQASWQQANDRGKMMWDDVQ